MLCPIEFLVHGHAVIVIILIIKLITLYGSARLRVSGKFTCLLTLCNRSLAKHVRIPCSTKKSVEVNYTPKTKIASTS